MKKKYPRIIQHHSELARLIDQLRDPTTIRFSEELERHAQDEEELLFSAAVLVGKTCFDERGVKKRASHVTDKSPDREVSICTNCIAMCTFHLNMERLSEPSWHVI